MNEAERLAQALRAPIYSLLNLSLNESKVVDMLLKQNTVLKQALIALEKMACLGNGDTHGNSVGNIMAIDLISDIQKVTV